jgi:hypothetical protein
MRKRFHPINLTAHWNAAQIRHIVTPALTRDPLAPETMRSMIRRLSLSQLRLLAESLWHHITASPDDMLTKKQVARIAGMTVSWLNNSQTEKARKLRGCGIRYGGNPSAPVRYPKLIVLRICRENEGLRPSS